MDGVRPRPAVVACQARRGDRLRDRPPRRGKWRYVMVTPDGFEVGFHGEYREIAPGERLVTTETFEGLPEGVSEEDGSTVNAATFEEVDGRTRVTLLIQAANKTSRDAIVESGMEDGLQDAPDLAEELAISL